MQYSDLFWCSRGNSPSRALKTVRRTVFARRDADGGHRLFESSLCSIPHSFIQNKKSNIHKDAALGTNGDTELFKKSRNINGFLACRIADNLY